MPLRYSELHHIQWWEDGGPTTLVNLAPECSFHHHEVHRLGLVVTCRADGTYEHRHPDGRLYGDASPHIEPSPAARPPTSVPTPPGTA